MIVPTRYNPFRGRGEKYGVEKRRAIPQFWRVLSVLSIAACQPHLPTAALPRDYARLGGPDRGAWQPELLVACRGHGRRLCGCLAGALLFREKQARHVHLPSP